MPNRDSICNTLVVWLRMLDRCWNEESSSWKSFGGKGIKICERWHRFDLFLFDMGPRPGLSTLKRLDPRADYCPTNCQWSDLQEDQPPHDVPRDRAKHLDFIAKDDANHRTFRIWSRMLAKCNNPENKYYGGRGLRVCRRWHKFKNFLADMGLAPDGLTLDRIHPDRDYKPSNCRWATPKEQANNKRSNKQWKQPPGVPRDTDDLLRRLKASARRKR